MARSANSSSESQSERKPAGARRRPEHEEERPDRNNESQHEGEPPNPCQPKAVARDPCNCPKTPGSPSRPERPKRPPPRRDDCCAQLVELLRGVPGLEGRKPHKPKQRPARKVQALCDSLGIAEAILPALAVLWERHEAGDSGRNNFEDKIGHIFGSIDKKDATALSYAFEQYRKLRSAGKSECLWNDCLADAAGRGPIERSWFAEEMLREGLKLAGLVTFRNSGGVMGPGQVRLWDNTVARGPNGSGATIYQGPWPWLTAIAPDMSSYEEYGNTESFRAVPGGAHIWQNYQYETECDYAPDPSGKIVATCARQHPTPPPPGGLVSFCDGGQIYTNANDCLRIPSQRPGGSIKLRGFNFITPTVRVRISRVGDPSLFREEECIVWGDQVTPLKDDKGHFIVDERVSDWVDCPLPSAHPTIPGAPLPAGLYEVVVKVANVTNAVYDSGTPAILTSNRLLLRMEADPNVKYLVWSNHGACNRETAGMGDDEIWWDAFVGHFVPKEVPVPPSGSSSLEIRDLERRSFPRAAWEDMDDNEGAGAYSIDIWGPKAFELYGVAVIGMVGFEVDSESAARDQLQGFWNAWGKALSDVAGVAFGAGGTATGLASLAEKAGIITARLAFSAALIALAVIAALVLIATAFWAAWAPADLIALDIMHFDAETAWDHTDPTKALPPQTTRAYEDPYDGESAIGVTQWASPKEHKKGDAAATFVQLVQYDTPEHGEDASYTLEFRLART